MFCERALLVAVLLGGLLHAAGVTVRFDPGSAEVGPFPSDALTVTDLRQKTGLRVNLPLPDCQSQPSTCAEIGLLNQLDGFNLQPRIRVRFSGPIDPDTLRAGIFLVWLENLTGEEYGLQRAGHVTPINQVLYDPATNTAFAKPDEFLDQHRRYALVVTDAVRDGAGEPVGAEPAFAACAGRPDGYCAQLGLTLARLATQFAPRTIVGASLFITLSATARLEKARAQLQSSSIDLQRTGSKSLFAVSELSSFVVRMQTGASPPAFEDLELPLALLAGVGRVAFGSFRSPSFLDSDQTIPATSTGQDLALPRSSKEIFFHAYLPPAPAPAAGYPVVIAGHGLNGSRFDFPSAVASTLASRGFATIAISAVGHGYGPDGKVILKDKIGNVIELLAGGRAVDMNGDGRLDGFEGCVVFGGPQPVGLRDCNRQTALDLMQLVRAIRTGMDLTGDGVADLDPNRIYYTGASLGAIYGAVFNAVEPDVQGAALTVGGGTVVDIARWSPSFRLLLTAALALRSPSLLNRRFDYEEAYVLRYRPVKIVDVPGAVEIQEFLERMEWLQMSGDPIAYATHLRSSTLPGVPIKRVLFQFAKGDRTVPNPASTSLIRAANMREMTSFYRHDLARALAPELPRDPHAFIAPLGSLAQIAIALAAQRQIAEFFAGDGASVRDVNDLLRPFFGRDLFEVPDFLTEDLNL